MEHHPKEGWIQAEGCPVKTAPFPKSRTQTEISLDIGSPSFRYVADEEKVGWHARFDKARYVTFCLDNCVALQRVSFTIRAPAITA
jgi:hypothetical protein